MMYNDDGRCNKSNSQYDKNKMSFPIPLQIVLFMTHPPLFRLYAVMDEKSIKLEGKNIDDPMGSELTLKRIQILKRLHIKP